MANVERKRHYIRDNQMFDVLVWMGSSSDRPDVLTESNVEPGVKYSPHKHKRWKLMEELTNHMRRNAAHQNPDHMIATVTIDPYNGRSCINSSTDAGIQGARIFGSRANARSVLTEKLKSIAQSKPTESSSKTRSAKGKRPLHRDHHRPRGTVDLSITDDVRSNGADTGDVATKPDVSALILEPKPYYRRDQFYRWTRRWRLGEILKSSRQWLKTYLSEVQNTQPCDLVDEMYPPSRSETDEEDPFETVKQNPTLHSDNPFCDAYGELITNKFTVCLKSLESISTIDYSSDKEQPVDVNTAIPNNAPSNSPRVFGIDLSPLLWPKLNVTSTDGASDHENDDEDGDQDPVSYQHVAYLIIRENETHQPSDDSQDSCYSCTVQLQVNLLPLEERSVGSEPMIDAKPRCEKEFSVKGLVEAAVEVLNSIRVENFDRNTCHPYEPFELDDPQTELAVRCVDPEDSYSHLSAATTEEEEDSTYVMVNHDGRCVSCDQPVTNESIQICVNGHQACARCLERVISDKLDSVCCGLNADEVCWTCLHDDCSTPLLRVAQLQVVPLSRLAPVWKCADFLQYNGYDLRPRGSDSPIFYGNCEHAPGVALVVRSESNHTFPLRPKRVAFTKSTECVQLIPRLYFPCGMWGQMHSPAPCDIAKQFRMMQQGLGDVACTDANVKAAAMGMNPIKLPNPDDMRSEAYCNALSAQWRQNRTGELLHLEDESMAKDLWKDERDNSFIPSEITVKWINTLEEIQSLVKYSFVMAHFEPENANYLDLASELMRKELHLGEALKVYPLPHDPATWFWTETVSRAFVERAVNNAKLLDSRFFPQTSPGIGHPREEEAAKCPVLTDQNT